MPALFSGLTRVVIAGIILLPSAVYGDCRQQLADIDAQMADTDLDPGVLGGIQMLRDQGAALCDQGNEEMANQMLAMVAMSLPKTKSQVSAEQTANTESKAGITDDFLTGTWCAIVKQENTQYIFTSDGSYQACVHDSMAGRYGHCSRPRPTSEWLAKFPRAQVVEQDTLVLGGKSGGGDYSTFKRGECTLYGL